MPAPTPRLVPVTGATLPSAGDHVLLRPSGRLYDRPAYSTRVNIDMKSSKIVIQRPCGATHAW